MTTALVHDYAWDYEIERGRGKVPGMGISITTQGHISIGKGLYASFSEAIGEEPTRFQVERDTDDVFWLVPVLDSFDLAERVGYKVIYRNQRNISPRLATQNIAEDLGLVHGWYPALLHERADGLLCIIFPPAEYTIEQGA